MIKVSIILATYNGERFIAQAIMGVLSQNFKDWELIIVNDGSTDNTVEIVKKFSIKDKRIIYLKNETNLGIQKSLNRGLKGAKGKYIARIDDDDKWVDKDKLKKQVEFLDENPDYVLVGTGTIVVDENSKELFRFFNPGADERIRRQLLGKNCFTHSSVMFRKEAVMKFGGYNESQDVRHIEDYDLWLKLGTIGKLANLPIYSVKFMIRKDTISARNKMEQFKKNIQLIKKYRGFYFYYWQALLRGYLRLIFYGVFNFLPLKSKILKFYKEHY